jgi:phosphoglycolate phosphatase-like HAD superfamily hydrolase
MTKNIIFDFDGVILDSVPVKTEAFRQLFQEYDKFLVDKFIEFHLHNGGKSRYVKIRYFCEELLDKNITDEQVNQLADKYSKLTKLELAKEKYIIQDTYEFIKDNYHKYNMHIASGADENDLQYICDSLDLIKFFKSIAGSPMVKSEIIQNILEANKYLKKETILIGDSINDYEAANINEIEFYGYNNHDLMQYQYITKFKEFT